MYVLFTQVLRVSSCFPQIIDQFVAFSVLSFKLIKMVLLLSKLYITNTMNAKVCVYVLTLSSLTAYRIFIKFGIWLVVTL